MIFQFVTDVDHKGDLLSSDGSQRLIVIDPSGMPYKNNRRNTKILKLNPGLLFPWADRVIWQDAKLLQSNHGIANHGNMPSPRGLPSDYLLYTSIVPLVAIVFAQATWDCLLIKLLLETPRQTVLELIARLLLLLLRRDLLYLMISKLYDSSVNTSMKCIVMKHYSSQVFYNQHPLVDTAFIFFYMCNLTCRKINGDFGCSWLNEIRCFSDRNQISFPYMLASSGLRLSPHMLVSGQEYRDRIYINEDQRPMVHIGAILLII
ncbi:hypothetical protein CTEN210_05687 [Chaetoceros tenuissimus]|uniref:Uncharacterized protein n=1 Tax=Chaetoceros tenuissimus TaxID=426638 RepID=A0AAD3CNH6_9STRA|nr:hypothetical protein CTEN210_05687 [Chaetoceros tenuissimus]